ncbi:MAG: PIN domain-containing protein [Proteobacteria bacterium]|nr:PIN domain-containing protein [Pseudomonadota bacterium]
MAKPTVYLETTVISLLTARPTRDVVQMALQQLTLEWWETRRHDFELYVSDFVLQEAARGDQDAARRRLELAVKFKELPFTGEIEVLAARLLEETRLPAKSKQDALHLASAAVHGVDYLLTWNCTHIANAVIIPDVRTVCRLAGFECPQICTPQELMKAS